MTRRACPCGFACCIFVNFERALRHDTRVIMVQLHAFAAALMRTTTYASAAPMSARP